MSGTSSLTLAVGVELVLTAFWADGLWAGPATGPLRVHPTNPRYFTDGSGQAVYLTGAHVWNNLQDWGYADPPPQFDYTGYLNFLQQHNHNFIRGWAWEHTMNFPGFSESFYITPHPFERTGPGNALDGKPRFDLTRFNQIHFNRIRSRVIQAANQGIYVSVMLFEGWSIDDKGKTVGNPWPGHPFNASNNINGIDGDPNTNGEGEEVHTGSVSAIVDIQEAYIRELVDTLNDLGNVLYEISNESHGSSQNWQYSMINYLKSYQSGKPNQHPVGMTVEYPGGSNSELFNSPADWISPNRYDSGFDYRDNPRASSGAKVILLDTDHLWGVGGDVAWVWKSFTRGHNPLFMDPKYGEITDKFPDRLEYEYIRNAMGHTRTYADRTDLAAMTPQNGGASPSTTGYCLYDSGEEYLVYQPGSGAFTVNLPAETYGYEWFDPDTGTVEGTGSITWGGGNRSFTPPFSGHAVLWLHPSRPVAVIQADPTEGTFPLMVSFDGSQSYDTNGTIVSYEWDFETDGTMDDTGVTTSHQYAEVGDYMAKLTVTDNDGRTDSSTVQIKVKPQPGDFDFDGDVDQEDFGHLQECLSGSGGLQTDPDCQDAILDGDEDVDQDDFGIFLACVSGPNVPADPRCAD